MKHIKTKGIRKNQWLQCNWIPKCDEYEIHIADKTFEYAIEYYSDLNELEGDFPTLTQMLEFEEKFADHELGYLAHRLNKLPDNEWYAETIYLAKPVDLTNPKYLKAAAGFKTTCSDAEREDVLIQVFFKGYMYKILKPDFLENFDPEHFTGRKVTHLTFIGSKERVKNVISLFNLTSTTEGLLKVKKDKE